MSNHDKSLLGALQTGRLSRNRHHALLCQGRGADLYRLHCRFLGLSRRLWSSTPQQQCVEKLDNEHIQIKILGLPGNGLEVACLNKEEARLFSGYTLPAWTKTAISDALGAY